MSPSTSFDCLRKARALGVAGLCAALLMAVVSLGFEGQPPQESYDAKAAFLYRFAKFVDWPPGKLGQASSPLVFGVFGEEGFDRINAVLADQMIDRRRIKVLPITDPEDFRECHILFVTRPRKGKPANTLITTGQAGLLTVGETDRFIEAGGMMRFYVEAGQLRLELNDEAVRKAGLTIKASALATLINQGTVKLKRTRL